MIAVATIEGIVLVLLTLLVGGLLRSHAEILHRLHHLDSGGVLGDSEHPLEPGVPLPRPGKTEVHDIIGIAPNGDSVKTAVIGTGESTILAFLSSGCLTCTGFWEAFKASPHQVPETPNNARIVIVTKGPDNESPRRIEELAPPGMPVIMSNDAWSDYQVPVAPYFMYVDSSSQSVVGEGAAVSWEQVVSLLRDSLADVGLLQEGGKRSVRHRRERRASARREREAERERRADAELVAAGVHPGHPSLYANPVTGEFVEPDPAEGVSPE